MPFSVILRVCGESRKSLKALDPPVKPGDDGCRLDSPVPPSLWLWTDRQPFDDTQGYESLDLLGNMSPSMLLRTMNLSNGLPNGMSNGPGDDDIITLITFHKNLFIMTIYNEKLDY
jgi:hypothetical protein